MILRLSLELPEAGAAYARVTRHLGRCLLEDLNVVELVIFDIESVLGELCSNVIHHARSDEGHYQVVLEYHADRLDIIVRDRGKGFAPAEVAPAGTHRPSHQHGERVGGFGLPLVALLVDGLEFHRTDPSGTTIRATKRLTYESALAAEEAARMDAPAGAVAGTCHGPGS